MTVKGIELFDEMITNDQLVNIYNKIDKYACMDTFKQVHDSCADQDIKNYLKELQDLIFYQMMIIGKQTLEIVAFKRQNARTNK